MGKNEDYDRTSLQGRENDVSRQDEELLVRLMEEAGEVIQCCSKVLRWGWSSTHPHDTTGEDNADALEREIDDFNDIIQRLRDNHATATQRRARQHPGLSAVSPKDARK